MGVHRILVVEDDPDVQAIVALTLRDAAFEVLVAEDGMHALLAASREPVDLVVLDLGLPDMSGEHVLERLRRASRVPVVVLSARADVDEAVHLRRAGADDCMLKPFYPEELVERVKHFLARPAPETPTFGPLEVDLVLGRARVNGAPLPLDAPGFALLAALARTPARLRTAAELADELGAEEGAVEEGVSDLRRVLRRHGAGGALRIVRRVGFALVPPS